MKARIIVSMASFLFLISCSTSRIINKWQSPNPHTGQFHSILVVGLFNNKDSALRLKMEDHLVGDLTERGYKATSSYREYGANSFQGLKEEEVLKKIQDRGVDGIITIVMLDSKKEYYYDIGKMLESPNAIFQRRFWGYYSSTYDLLEEPGYYAVSTSYFWESNFYEMAGKELIYSVQTKSFDPASADRLAHEYGKLIISSMAKDKILDGG